MIAIVPARSGSKGLVGKNLKILSGRPLIEHTLRGALDANFIDEVIVSTDDAKIAALASSIQGVEAPFLRPAHLASDSSSAIDVYLHAIDFLEQQRGVDIDRFCVLLPTSPLRLPQDIDCAIDMFHKNCADVVVSVQCAKPLPWHQRISGSFKLSDVAPLDTKEAVANRQQLDDSMVVLNGSIYVMNTNALRMRRTYFGEKTYGYMMPADRSIDIDNIVDFRIAEALMDSRSAP